MSAAEELARRVALCIGMTDPTVVNLLCENLRKEHLREEWQLATLESSEWRELGASLGLAASIRAFCGSESSSGGTQGKLRDQLPPLEAPTCKGRAPEIDEEQGRVPRSSQTVSPTENEADNNQAAKDEKMPDCVYGVMSSLKEYPDQSSIFSRPFPMSARFLKGMIHSKDGNTLKDHTMFVINSYILVSALFLGASVELWGVFPYNAVTKTHSNNDDDNQRIPRALATLFTITCFLSVKIHLLNAMGWICKLLAVSAVSPKKFTEFMVQTQYTFISFSWLMELGIGMTTLTICLLISALNCILWDDPIVRQIGFYLPALFAFWGYRMIVNFSSFVGRVAFHGLMLVDEEPDVVMQTSETASGDALTGIAEKSEEEVNDNFWRHNLKHSKHVLDLYHNEKMNTKKPKRLDEMCIFDQLRYRKEMESCSLDS
jgi:hypothetical protein